MTKDTVILLRLGILLLVFFLFFGLYTPRNYIDRNISVSLSIEDPAASNIKEPSGRSIKISYIVSNSSEKVYSAKDLFFRIVLSKSYDSPGFILKEFSKDVLAKTSFKGDYIWSIENTPTDGKDFKIYFYIYKSVNLGDPVLVSFSESPILKFY